MRPTRSAWTTAGCAGGLDDGTLPYVLVGSGRRVSQLMLAEWQRCLVDAARERATMRPRAVGRPRVPA